MSAHNATTDISEHRRRLLMGAAVISAAGLPGLAVLSNSENAMGATPPMRPLTISIPGVREFQRRYEQAVPREPRDEMSSLLQRQAPWSDMEERLPAALHTGS